MLWMMSFILVLIVYVVFLLVSEKMEEEENLWSSFECGFDPSGLTRSMFSYKFFVVAVLFLIFDVEIALLLPIPMLSEEWLVQIWFLLFMLFLLVGILYEIELGVLEWVK